MAKNNVSAKGISTSALPIPVTDSPLVIDLPDGQKIVLGRISSGTVIEVATWRGTGRPDSRTNRIMLGMSDASNMEATESSSNVESKSKSKSEATQRLGFQGKQLIAPVYKIFSRVTQKASRYTAKRPVEETHNLEIDAWIEKISADLQAKSAAPTQATRRTK